MGKTTKTIYNLEQKQEYMDYSHNDVIQLFKDVSECERESGKDVCEMNELEARQLLIGLEFLTEVRIKQAISRLNQYVEWARIFEKTKNENVFKNIKADTILRRDVVEMRMLKDPEQVKEILSVATNTEIHMFERNWYYKQTGRSKRDQLVFWLLYSGFSIRELQGIKKNDLDYKALTVNGKWVHPQVMELWADVVAMNEIECSGANTTRDVFIRRLEDNRFLLRNTTLAKRQDTATSLSGLKITGIVKRIICNYAEETDTPMVIPPENVRNSYLFYKLYQFEKEGGKITNEILAEILGIKYNNYDQLVVKTKEKFVNYCNWKITFGYA